MTSKHKYLMQKSIEQKISKRGIHSRAYDLVQNHYGNEIQKIVAIIPHWLTDPNHWVGKLQRLEEIYDLDFEDVLTNIAAIIAVQCHQKTMKLVSIASMCAKFLNMDSKPESIQTCAELIGLMKPIDIFDYGRNEDNSVILISNMTLTQELIDHIQYACFLPPMLHPPKRLRHNRSSGYITQQGQSLILGGYTNHHEGCISLDVLNTLNSVAYEIDTQFIASHVEEWHREQLTTEEYKELSRADKALYNLNEQTWEDYQEQCQALYNLIIREGNVCYFNHRIDKRGRIYAQGYHLNPQGKPYKKAMLNLKSKEICTGVQEWNFKCTST